MGKVAALDYIVIILYFAAMIYAGYLGYKKTKDADSYFVAGRRLGGFMFTACMVAVAMGGASTVGATRLGYKFGLSGAWMNIMIGIGIFLLGVLLATKISKLRMFTVSEMLGKRYDRFSQLISAIIMACYVSIIATIQIIGIGTIFHLLFGWSAFLSMLIAGIVVIAYTYAGGMWSVTLTDVVQFCVITVGIFFILLPCSLSRVGGFAGLSQLDPKYFAPMNIGKETVIAYFLLFVFGLLIGQDLWQRVFTARTPQIARAGTAFAGLYSILLGLATAVIGMCALIVFPKLEDPNFAFAYISAETVPIGLLGLVLAAALAAMMSTASGPILASSTLICTDIIGGFVKKGKYTKEQLVKWGKIVSLINGAVCLICALWIQDIISAIDLAYNLLTGAMFFPIMGAILWKRSTWQGSIAGMLCGAIVVIQQMAAKGMTSTDAIIYGLLASLIGFVVVSLLTPPMSKEKAAEWEAELNSVEE